MGLIYCYTAPNGKKYIGQTKKTFEERDKEHVKSANSKKKYKCTAFHAALLEHGRENFKTEILIECNDDMLNKYEKYYVERFNTLHPNGLNMRTGGTYNTELSDESRQNISTNLKKVNPELPMYMTAHKNKDGKLIGYSIHRHPKDGRQITFIRKKNAEEAFNLAKECLEYLNNLKDNEKNTKYLPKVTGGQRQAGNEDLPKYISPTKNKKGEYNGYKVEIHKHKILKYFRVQGANNLQNAKDYLEDLKRTVLRD